MRLHKRYRLHKDDANELLAEKDAEIDRLSEMVVELSAYKAESDQGDAAYYEITEGLTDRANGLRAAIVQARQDLDGLPHVPLHDLEASIEDIRRELGGVL